MQITYLIGNGFDVAMGLNTRYSDFNAAYQVSDSLEPCLQTFKKNIKAKSDSWGYAELQLGKYTSNFNPFNIKAFRVCYDDYIKKLSEFLRMQNDRIDVNLFRPEITLSFTKAFSMLRDFLPSDVVPIIDALFLSKECEKHLFNCIVFNYTNLFDRCVGVFLKNGKCFRTRLAKGLHYDDILNEIVHVHGELDNAMLLGVDNERQIANPLLLNNDKVRHALIKPDAVSAVHKRAFKKSCDFIRNSSLICVFGMSIGETDITWWKLIGKWLLNDVNNQLIIFIYQLGYDPANAGQRVDIIADAHKRFIRNASIKSSDRIKVMNQIHIVVNVKLFGESLVLNTMC